MRRCDTHSDELVARAKAVMKFGVSIKATCRYLDLPYTLVRDWKNGKRRKTVPPDAEILKRLLDALEG